MRGRSKMLESTRLQREAAEMEARLGELRNIIELERGKTDAERKTFHWRSSQNDRTRRSSRSRERRLSSTEQAGATIPRPESKSTLRPRSVREILQRHKEKERSGLLDRNCVESTNSSRSHSVSVGTDCEFGDEVQDVELDVLDFDSTIPLNMQSDEEEGSSTSRNESNSEHERIAGALSQSIQRLCTRSGMDKPGAEIGAQGNRSTEQPLIEQRHNLPPSGTAFSETNSQETSTAMHSTTEPAESAMTASGQVRNDLCSIEATLAERGIHIPISWLRNASQCETYLDTMRDRATTAGNARAEALAQAGMSSDALATAEEELRKRGIVIPLSWRS